MKQAFYAYLMRVGRCLGCHQMPARSFFFKNHQFPICARCTGVFIGQALGMISNFYHKLSYAQLAIFAVIMFVDWGLQRVGILPSTNIRRLVTGTLCGFSLGQVYIRIIVFLPSIL